MAINPKTIKLITDKLGYNPFTSEKSEKELAKGAKMYRKIMVGLSENILDTKKLELMCGVLAFEEFTPYFLGTAVDMIDVYPEGSGRGVWDSYLLRSDKKEEPPKDDTTERVRLLKTFFNKSNPWNALKEPTLYEFFKTVLSEANINAMLDKFGHKYCPQQVFNDYIMKDAVLQRDYFREVYTSYGLNEQQIDNIHKCVSNPEVHEGIIRSNNSNCSLCKYHLFAWINHVLNADKPNEEHIKTANRIIVALTEYEYSTEVEWLVEVQLNWHLIEEDTKEKVLKHVEMDNICRREFSTIKLIFPESITDPKQFWKALDHLRDCLDNGLLDSGEITLNALLRIYTEGRMSTYGDFSFVKAGQMHTYNLMVNNENYDTHQLETFLVKYALKKGLDIKRLATVIKESSITDNLLLRLADENPKIITYLANKYPNLFA